MLKLRKAKLKGGKKLLRYNVPLDNPQTNEALSIERLQVWWWSNNLWDSNRKLVIKQQPQSLLIPSKIRISYS
jgi:hypothetical protein